MNTAVLTCIFFTPALSQNGKTGEMIVTDAGVTVKAQVLMHPPKAKADQTHIYYWYRSDKIMSTQGGWEGKLLHGHYTAFYPNKNLKEKGKFEYGLKDGIWTSWYENGQIRETTNWDDGLKQGVFKEYTEKGELMREGKYVKDRLDGKLLIYESGKIVREETYRNGEMAVKQKEDKQTGKGFLPFLRSKKQKGE